MFSDVYSLFADLFDDGGFDLYGTYMFKEGKGREGKGRERKGREGKSRHHVPGTMGGGPPRFKSHHGGGGAPPE